MRQPTLIFATFLAPVLYKTCLYITEYIEQYTGIPTFLLPGEDFEDFAAGAIDGGFLSGMAYVQLADQQPAPIELAATAPALQEQKRLYEYTPHALSDIVVRKNSAFTSIEDLRVLSGHPATRGTGRSHRMPNFNLCTKHSLSKCPPGSGLSPLLTSIHYACSSMGR